ncbi:hypothetical protein M422DRAFT_276659 [Sphaerobolus stellatus SS14]|uniref:Uncharacterized protein n=1 Tax=Sphaerobolus stellatus (strain SS14) TaxID=990650 RepID=A0A0C9UBF9_SPHS4|nr:hypothetical protein M422DRAFT_276659 [Sphaerobolus stellatus SS14]
MKADNHELWRTASDNPLRVKTRLLHSNDTYGAGYLEGEMYPRRPHEIRTTGPGEALDLERYGTPEIADEQAELLGFSWSLLVDALSTLEKGG